MDHVQPSLTENVCDPTREEEIVIFWGTAISAIFIKYVTRLLNMALAILANLFFSELTLFSN